MDELQDAVDQGYDAFWARQSVNPYIEGSMLHEAWWQGWSIAEESQEEN